MNLKNNIDISSFYDLMLLYQSVNIEIDLNAVALNWLELQDYNNRFISINELYEKQYVLVKLSSLIEHILDSNLNND